MTSTADSLPTVWVLGDQLHRNHGALRGRVPGDCRVLLVESESSVSSATWHRQRLHLVLSAMEHFAFELRDEGFDVDHRRARSLRQGLTDHVAAHSPSQVLATEPNRWDAHQRLVQWGVELVRNDHFLCHYTDFARWAADRKRLTMEDFYRWQRVRLGVLVDDDGDGPQPVGGRWSFDHDNREPPPRDGRRWPGITRFELDDIDRGVLERMPSGLTGADPDGTWPVTRAQALVRLAVLSHVLVVHVEAHAASVDLARSQMDEAERRTYLAESLFLNTVRYENDKLESYMKRLASR